jgi:hypothetical protein
MNLDIVFLTALGLSAVCFILAVVIAIMKAWNRRRVLSFVVKILTVLVILLVGEGIANWLINFDGWGWILALPISLITLMFAWGLFKVPGPFSKQEDANYALLCSRSPCAGSSNFDRTSYCSVVRE